MQAATITLAKGDRRKLERLRRAASAEQRQALRADIILVAAEGHTNQEIAARLGINRKTAGKWRGRYTVTGFDGLTDLPRSGRPRIVDPVARCQILAMACCLPETGVTEAEQAQQAFTDMMQKVDVPEDDQQVVNEAVGTVAAAIAKGLQAKDTPARTHWTIASLHQAVLEAEIAQLSESTLWRVLNHVEIRPHRQQMWMHSTDPLFKEKVTEICDLYLNPPDGALVICVDEKTGMQILQRKYPSQPPGPGRLSRREYEYKRLGTMCLFAGFEVHTGRVFGRLRGGRTNWDTRCFMKELATWHPEGDVHIIWDNLNTHCGDYWTQEFNEEHGGRFHFHYTPLHASWVNQVECFFSILTRRVLRRGDFCSRYDFAWKMKTFIQQWNNHEAKPFRWRFRGYPLELGLREAA